MGGVVRRRRGMRVETLRSLVMDPGDGGRSAVSDGWEVAKDAVDAAFTCCPMMCALLVSHVLESIYLLVELAVSSAAAFFRAEIEVSEYERRVRESQTHIKVLMKRSFWKAVVVDVGDRDLGLIHP